MRADQASGPEHDQWWRTAVIYQIYPRSFADASGDGVGDLPGITERLPTLAELGIDAVWLSPFFRSPMLDAGYDVSDYCDVDPQFGTLADFDAMLARAHELGIRVIVDLVPNHSSSRHRWFREALAAEPGSPERARYLFRDGRGEHGELHAAPCQQPVWEAAPHRLHPRTPPRPAALAPERPMPSARGNTRIAACDSTQCFSQLPQPVHWSVFTVGTRIIAPLRTISRNAIASPRTGHTRTHTPQLNPL